MSRDHKTVLAWLKHHGVSGKLRRFFAFIWLVISLLVRSVLGLLQSRYKFFTALVIGIIAALILAESPVAGGILAGVGLSIAILAGCIEELKAAFKR